MTIDFTTRIAAAHKAVADADIDALFVTPSPDLRYLTGYAAKELERLTCLVVPAHGPATIVVPTLERAAALASPIGDSGLEVRTWDETDDPYALAAGLLPAKPDRIAVGDRTWTMHSFPLCEAVGAATAVPAGPMLRELRMRKSADEVEALRQAGAAIDRVHGRMGEWLRPGRTEEEVARDIRDAIVEEGHVAPEFAIVGSGPHSASPHHEPSGRVIETGDVVVVDIGGITAAGYCSDSTRTYLVGGTPDPAFAKYYAVLQEAQETSVASVRPGVTAESVDAGARNVIAAAGYGEQFFHRTGHGIGMEAHEEPYIVAGNELLLEPGMAFSVEPGIYFAGQHGARIEDIVVVTEDGVERVNHTTRELVIL